VEASLRDTREESGSRAIIVSRPADPAALVLLFHGVGSSAANLVPLARLIAGQQPDAMVVSVSAAHPSAFGGRREWFSVAGVTEENRPRRVAQAMRSFESAVTKWQAEAGVGMPQTTLIGFSQGAIMSPSLAHGIDERAAKLVLEALA